MWKVLGWVSHSADMDDVPPNQVIRLLQLGLVDEALKLKTIWLCASCETCTTRYPREVGLTAGTIRP